MVARTQLAVLDHNANVNRTQAEVKKGSKQGEKRFKIVCGKQRKNWVAKEIKTPKSYSYVEGMMNDVILCKKGKKFKYKPKFKQNVLHQLLSHQNRMSLISGSVINRSDRHFEYMNWEFMY
jgi:hypothetical protein